MTYRNRDGDGVCRGFRVVPEGTGRKERRIQRLVDFLIEETLTTPDDEILKSATANDEQTLRAEIDRAIAKVRGK
jgi:hypothetical protein